MHIDICVMYILAMVLFFNLKNKNDEKEENETKPHTLSLRVAKRLSYLFIRLAETAMTKGCWDTCSPTFKGNANKLPGTLSQAAYKSYPLARDA